jgi:hypothetical protein
MRCFDVSCYMVRLGKTLFVSHESTVVAVVKVLYKHSSVTYILDRTENVFSVSLWKDVDGRIDEQILKENRPLLDEDSRNGEKTTKKC